MNFKKPKEDVYNEVYTRVDGAFRNAMYAQMGPYSPYPSYPMGNTDPHQLINILTHAVTVACAEAVSTMIENVYTDAEFEKDIGLTEKD